MAKTTGKKTTSTKGLGAATTKAIDQAAEKVEQIERAKADAVLSKQPRFAPDRKSINNFFNLIYGIAKEAIFNEPPYAADSSKRDTWLAKVVRKEPYLLGILQSVVSIDKNRGWTMVGGKIQVKKFVNILHNFQVSPDLYGWRNGLSVSAQSFYQADLGTVVEIGRSVTNGPLAALYTVDPSKCHLTGKIETPLKYNNGARDKQMWEPNDYFRIASFPSPTESMNGLGYCAISRCLELAKLLVSVFEHDREQLGSKAPKGILTINGGMTLAQWLLSLEESTAELKSLEREYYSGVQVLVGDQGQEIKVALTSLSNLPADFNHSQFITMIIGGYALAFGYDPREFWSMSSGALGTSRETEQQHRKASSKGGLDFALGFQEKLQEELPETLEFEFEQRDVEGDIAEVQFNQQKLDLVDQMYKSVNARNETLVTYGEARQLLVDAKLIPEEWTPEEEDVQIMDTDDMGEVIEKQRVQNALAKFPDDDIVIYSENSGKYRTIRKAGQKKFMVRVGGKPSGIKKKMRTEKKRGGPGSGRHPEGGSSGDASADDEGGSFQMMADGGIEWVPSGGGDAGASSGESQSGSVKTNAGADRVISEMSEDQRTVITKSGASEVRVVSAEEMKELDTSATNKTAGTVIDGSKSILILDQGGGEGRTLIHESAHILDSPDADGKYAISESKEWLDAAGWEQNEDGSYQFSENNLESAVSDYARSAPWEDFAETFATAVYGDKYDRQAMSVESPKRYEYIKQVVEAQYGIKLNP